MEVRLPIARADGLLTAMPSVAVAVSVLAILTVSCVGSAHADAVVGTGSPSSCTEAALDAGLGAGGNVTFNCGASPITLTVTITKSIALDTNLDGHDLVTISGGGLRQIFRVSSVAVLGLRNITLTGSNGSGAILNAGTLIVTNSTFSSNNAPHVGGGAIYNRSGTLTVTNSTFSNNSGLNGAIFNAGTLTVTNSTFSNNDANYGGAIFNPGTLTVTNSTFSSNNANYDGGAIFNGDAGTLTVTNSTFSDNRASSGSGGAIFNSNVGTVDVTSSTFSGNSATNDGGAVANINGAANVSNAIVADSPGNCFGVITDGGHNLEDGTSCGFTTAKGSLIDTDPKLDPAGPQNNGGPTQTIALVAGSPAIDAGNQTICAAPPVKNLDQRGFVRPGVGHTHCSIGAYEADATLPEACTGDCDHSGTVTVDELLTMVSIALGNTNVSDCSAGDANHDNQVTIDEILAAVNNALNGCAAAAEA